MLEMIYQERLDEPIVLDCGTYKGYKYHILSLGSHPTAYIEIPKEHKLNGKDYDEINEYIIVHGGVTYAKQGLSTTDTENWVIGWDYAHLGDCYYTLIEGSGKKYTTAEILVDVKDVINQLGGV